MILNDMPFDILNLMQNPANDDRAVTGLKVQHEVAGRFNARRASHFAE